MQGLGPGRAALTRSSSRWRDVSRAHGQAADHADRLLGGYHARTLRLWLDFWLEGPGGHRSPARGAGRTFLESSDGQNYRFRPWRKLLFLRG
jgi:hypothetical protein